MNAYTAGRLALVAVVGFGIAACDDGGTAVEPGAALLSVTPSGGADHVALDAAVVVTFDGPMDAHASDFMAIHHGDVTGETVRGTWMTEDNGSTMRFMADHGWQPGSEYTIHLGGGMVDADGHMVDIESHGAEMGGMWAEGSMMEGGMMGGQNSHMGEGWQDEHGGYGMLFPFTTDGEANSSLIVLDPQGGATDVDPTAPVVVTFDHAMNPEMAEYAALHEGDVNGPEVEGTWSLSEDSMQLIFTQDQPLKRATEYTIHLGAGMMDAEGHHVDMDAHGPDMGGEWATDGMMGGGMHGGQHNHMGEGWDDPGNDSHGMLFTFTTAS